MASSEEDLLFSCSICFKSYTQIGKQVPRLLPCTHCYCEECIENMLTEPLLNKGSNLCCPECRQVHPAQRGFRSFPQNKYILLSLRRPQVTTDEDSTGDGNDGTFDKCQNDRNEANFYCRNSTCQMAICPYCFFSHRNHEVVEIKEERENMIDIIYSNLDSITRDLRSSDTKIAAARDDVANRNSACVDAMKKRKEKLILKIQQDFDKMIKDAQDQIAGLNASIENEQATLQEYLVLADSIRENTRRNVTPIKAVKTNLETLKEIRKTLDDEIAPSKVYAYFRYTESEADVEQLYGKIEEKHIRVKMPETEPFLAGRKTALLFTCKGK